MRVLNNMFCLTLAAVTVTMAAGCTSDRDTRAPCLFKDIWAKRGEEVWTIRGTRWPIATTYFRMKPTSSEPEIYSIECWWPGEQRLKHQKKDALREKAFTLAIHACRNKLYNRNAYTEEEVQLLCGRPGSDTAATDTADLRMVLKPTHPPKNVDVWLFDQPDKTKVADSQWFQFALTEIEVALRKESEPPNKALHGD